MIACFSLSLLFVTFLALAVLGCWACLGCPCISASFRVGLFMLLSWLFFSFASLVSVWLSVCFVWVLCVCLSGCYVQVFVFVYDCLGSFSYVHLCLRCLVVEAWSFDCFLVLCFVVGLFACYSWSIRLFIWLVTRWLVFDQFPFVRDIYRVDSVAYFTELLCCFLVILISLHCFFCIVCC